MNPIKDIGDEAFNTREGRQRLHHRGAIIQELLYLYGFEKAQDIDSFFYERNIGDMSLRVDVALNGEINAFLNDQNGFYWQMEGWKKFDFQAFRMRLVLQCKSENYPGLKSDYRVIIFDLSDDLLNRKVTSILHYTNLKSRKKVKPEEVDQTMWVEKP